MKDWVAFYDHETGEITAITSGTPGSLIAHRRPYAALTEYRIDWDQTHIVVNDQVVPRPAAALEALRLERALSALRQWRAGLLKNEVDPIVTNPLRWDALTQPQQEALLAYRLALLDWPEAETDPLNPTPPVAPEI